VPEKKLVALASIEQVIAWRWAIVIAFSAPEIGTFVRSVRLVFFKKINNFRWKDFGIVAAIEIAYTLGMCLMAFCVIPEIDSIRGAMITNCLGVIAGVLCEKFNF
jgi:chitin synthase